MASPNDVPRISEPIAGQGGYLTQAWLNFFMKLASQQSGAELEAQIQALEQLVQQIQQAQGANLQINGPLSVEVQGIPANGVVTLTLKGDTSAPGNTYVYGTGPAGGKGWYPLADAIAVAAGQISKAVGANGVATLGLDPAVIASLAKADSAVQSIVAGTGVTVNNADPRNPIVSAPGATGLPEAPIDGNPYARMDAAWQQIHGPGSRFFLIEYPLLTDQLGNQLTDQAGNPLIANSPIIPPGWPSMTTIVVAAAPQVLTLSQANALAGVLDGQEVLITDLAGGREPCWYDATISSGTRWRRYSDRSIAN
ncbi:hypothetical protein [Stenotrophomonas sp. BIGb0135]|uniref:hypothetical protein n=1 Tax=Stenotrophomonas sp. BIGb0135 TaxID=2940620 RepID=UPI002169DB2D|nr:hypothetical protein [Stenotrophomonas sp. BIGb0135]MCS4234404.1 hypothetical protein [Stenotrophomonas sp. BIGb0135]